MHLTYPGQYTVDVNCTARELYDFNPDVVKYQGHDLYGEVHYEGINQSNEVPIHFMAAMCDGVSRIIKRPVPLKVNRPVLVLSEEEKQWSGVLTEIAPEPTPFALLNCGSKRDFTTKGFGPTIGQELVDHYAGTIKFVQTGTSNELHTPLRDVTQLIDRTPSVRDLARLVYWSDFGVGPVTLLMWMYAALSKPYFGMIGGREPLSWVTTPNLVPLTTFGILGCCRERSCWKSRVVPLGDNTPNDRSLCSLPVVMSGGEPIAGCHARVGSWGLTEAISRMFFARDNSI